MLALRRDISLAGITQKDGRVRLNDYPLSGELASRPAESALIRKCASVRDRLGRPAP